MNSISSRLKAIAVAALFFGLSAFALLGLIWGLAALPFPVPGLSDLSAYRPNDTMSALADLRLPVALTSAFLVATGLVLLFDSAYLDKMIAIFADVLLMAMAASIGFIFGYWVLLRLAGGDGVIGLDVLQIAAICPVMVFAVSLIPLWRVRAVLVLRILVIAALCFAAPALLLGFPL